MSRARAIATRSGRAATDSGGWKNRSIWACPPPMNIGGGRPSSGLSPSRAGTGSRIPLRRYCGPPWPHPPSGLTQRIGPVGSIVGIPAVWETTGHTIGSAFCSMPHSGIPWRVRCKGATPRERQASASARILAGRGVSETPQPHASLDTRAAHALGERVARRLGPGGNAKRFPLQMKFFS